MSDDVTATMVKRTERHEIEVELLVSGHPVIEKPHLCTKYPIRPTSVLLHYVRSGELWTARARVYGQPVNGSIVGGWADFFTRSGGSVEHWPEWLRDLADEQHPARPADDPEGSYL